MVLVNRNVLRSTVNLAGRGEDDLLRLQFAGRLKHVQRPLDIGVQIGLRSVVGIGNANQGCQVKNHVPATHGFANAEEIANVAEDNLKLSLDWRLVQPTPSPRGGVPHQGPNVSSQ